MTKKGTVKWYSEEKGFGVITPDNGGIDAFVSASQVQAAGYEKLYNNTKVSYVEKTFSNKNQAFNIKIISIIIDL